MMDIQITRLPLELSGYFFQESNIVFSPSDKEGDKFNMPPDINLTTSARKNKDHPEIWEISVRVQTIKENKEKKYNLEFNVCALGFFKNTNEQEENEMTKQIIRVNGAAILLGAIRERLAVTTGTSPFGPYFLPSLAIRIVDDNSPNDDKAKDKEDLTGE